MRAFKWIVFGIFLVLHGLIILGATFGSFMPIIAGVAGVIAGVMFMFNR